MSHTRTTIKKKKKIIMKSRKILSKIFRADEVMKKSCVKFSASVPADTQDAFWINIFIFG